MNIIPDQTEERCLAQHIQQGLLPSFDTLETCIWLEYLLLGDLRESLDEPSGRVRHEWLTALLAAFIDNLARVSQLRNDGGDVSEVLDELPHWHRGMAEFMDETGPERLRLEELLARLELGLPHESVSREVREDLDIWLKSLGAHRLDAPPVDRAALSRSRSINRLLHIPNVIDTILERAYLALESVAPSPLPQESRMPPTAITREQFLQHKLGRTFADVSNDDELSFDKVLEFFSDSSRQRRMEESELHHDRPPLAGVVRELESLPEIARFLGGAHPRRTQRLRQAVGVVVRMVMERHGWRKTGRKGSLGVRANVAPSSPIPGSHHNTGGLSLWFVRAERYERTAGMPYLSVRHRCRQFEAASPVAADESDSNGESQRSRRPNGAPLGKKSKR